MAEIELAIWMYYPESMYTLNEAKTAILEWRDPVLAEPTAMQLANAEAAYDAIVDPETGSGSAWLTVDVTTIDGDGVDEATVTLHYAMPYAFSDAGGENTVEALVNGEKFYFTLDEYTPGSFDVRTAIETFTSLTPGTIIIVQLLGSYQGVEADTTEITIEVI